MILRQILLFWMFLNITFGNDECPKECHCGNDIQEGDYVECTNGGMKTIPVAFMNENVEKIYIHGESNNLTIGPIFQSFQKLRILRIVRSNIPAIGFKSFLGLIYLRILDLSDNNITTIYAENFYGLSDLLELNLSGNNIEGFSSASFRFLKGLRTLNLENNLIQELAPRQFLDLKKLKNLDLSFNPLNALPIDVFRDINHLGVLKCRQCHLKILDPGLMRELLFLIELDFGYNKIRSINEETFSNLRKLKYLRLDGNRLTKIEDSIFENQKSLLHLNLSHNVISIIKSEGFYGLHNLTNLDLSYNKIKILNSNSLQHLISLKSLNLSGNVELNLIELELSLKIIDTLEILSLSDLNTNFNTSLQISSAELRFLDLSGNNINHTLSINFFSQLPNLEFLSLNRNQFNGMSEKLAARLQKIKNVELLDNPLICDRCHSGPLIDSAGKLQWKKYPVCRFPEKISGLTVMDMNIRSLEWCFDLYGDDERVYTVSGVSAEGYDRVINAGAYIFGALIAIIFLSCIGLAIYTRHGAKYYTHEDKMDNNLEKNLDGIPSSGNEINFKFPYNDGVCTVDEIYHPSPPLTPTKPKGVILR